MTSKSEKKYSNKDIIKWINQSPDMDEVTIKKELKRWVRDYKIYS